MRGGGRSRTKLQNRAVVKCWTTGILFLPWVETVGIARDTELLY